MDQLEWLRQPADPAFPSDVTWLPAVLLPDGVVVRVREHSGVVATAQVDIPGLSLVRGFMHDNGGLQAALRFAGSHLSGHLPRALDEMVAQGPTPKMLPPISAPPAPNAEAAAPTEAP